MGRALRCLVTGRIPVVCTVVSFALFLVVAGGPGSAGAAAGPIAAGTAGGPGLQVTSSTPAGLTLALDGLEPRWRQAYLGGDGAPRWTLAFDGFVTGGVPGGLSLPTWGSWLVVPPGTRPVVRVVTESWQAADGRQLAFETQPVQVPGEEAGEGALREMLLEPGDALPAGATALGRVPAVKAVTAGAAVVVDEPQWWRGRRIAACRVLPVRHDARGSVQQVLACGRWEIAFVPEAGKAAVPALNAQLSDGRNDARFAASFLNGGLLGRLPTEGSLAPAAAPQAAQGVAPRAGAMATLLGPEARLAISRTGPVRVTYARLRQRGLIPDVPIQESQVRLYQRRYLPRVDTGTGAPWVEVEVPIRMVGEGDAFDGDDFFVFHGLRLRDDTNFLADVGSGTETIPGSGDPWEMNNEANLYWLACAQPGAGESWARMATTTIAPAAGTPLVNFRHEAHMEEQAAFRENLPLVTSDRLYLNVHTDTEASLALSPFWRPDPAGSPASLSVQLAGFNSGARPLRLQLVTDTANVTLLEDYSIATPQPVTRSFSVPASALNGTTTKVVMSRGTGASPFLFAYLNSFDIAYDALYQAVNGELRFHGGDFAGAVPLEVTGLTSADVGLLDVTDPRAPVFVNLQAGNVVADGGSWKLSLTSVQTGARRHFHALSNFGTTGVTEFNYVKSSVAADPTDPTAVAGGDPDLVVVTHPSFRAALDRWVQHRVARSGGTLRVHVVDVDDLYDWYSGGLRDPWAIKRFCNRALADWESWALVVVGDANENALGKRVLSQADAWATDWVPTHYHVQRALSYEPELMASDKWYVTASAGTTYPVEDFPRPVATPCDMLAGRLPCNSVAELDLMIDKVIGLETPQAGQDWRRRGLFVADDEWSNGYGAEALTTLEYSPGETDFLDSERDTLAAQWAGGTGVPLEGALVSLKGMLDTQFPYDPQNPGTRPLNTVRQYTAASATPQLLAALSQGGLFCSYQGHANQYVLSSEYWLQDMPTIPNQRVDTALLANTGKPWFFIGLGCHIGDWAQNPVKSEQAPQERSIGEKLLLRPNAGASALYASSGYEFIIANRIFGEYISRRWTGRPPAGDLPGAGGSSPGRGRWVLGELLWAAESDLAASVAYRTWPYNEMVAQYVLLGDPLLTLDAGGPVVEASLGGETVSGTVPLVATDATNLRTLDITAGDEAGIDRLEVVDDQGNDLTSQVAVESRPAGAQTWQRANYTLSVPVLPYDHALTVKVYDTGAPLPGDRHWELVLDMPQTAIFTVGGQAHDPQSFAFETGVPVAFSGTVSTSAWLDDQASTLALTSTTLDLSAIDFNVNKGRGLTVDFTATATAAGSASGHSVILSIDGHETELVLQAAPDDGGVAGIGRVLNYPNPMGEDTRFLVETEMAGQGRINLWSVAGSPVARLGFDAGGDDAVVDWDGTDAHGDELANGTYLYRVEIDGPLGTARSEVQRLVIMR